MTEQPWPNGRMKPEDGENSIIELLCETCGKVYYSWLAQPGMTLTVRNHFHCCGMPVVGKREIKPKPACPDYGEPWSGAWQLPAWTIADNSGELLCKMEPVVFLRIPSRIVLCINACQGITNEELEKRIADAKQHQQDDA